MPKDLIIDNAGYDVEAWAAKTADEFVETHLPNDAIGKNLSPADRKKYLKGVHKAIKQAAGNVTPEIVEEKAPVVEEQPPSGQ